MCVICERDFCQFYFGENVIVVCVCDGIQDLLTVPPLLIIHEDPPSNMRCNRVGIKSKYKSTNTQIQYKDREKHIIIFKNLIRIKTDRKTRIRWVGHLFPQNELLISGLDWRG